MKKIMFLMAFLGVITTANAQFVAGGSLGFTSTKIESGGSDQSGSSFKIMPEIGYQLDDKLTIGVQVGYSSGFASFGSLTASDLKSAISTVAGAIIDIENDDMKLSGFTISPYIRYTLVELGQVNFFAEGYIGYNNITTDTTPSVGSSGYGGDKTTINAFELGVRPGIAVKLSDAIELNCKMGALGYMSAKEKESDLKINRFGLSFDSYNLLFGVNFHF